MEAANFLSHPKVIPLGFALVSHKVSLTPFNKHFHADSGQFHPRPTHIVSQLNCSFGKHFPSLLKPTRKRADLLPSPRCSVSSEASTEPQNPILKYFRDLSVESVKATLLELTPVDIVKFSWIISTITAAIKWTRNTLFSPFFWMYFSWTWLFWPWLAAILFAIYGLYCFRKHLHGEANIFEQLAVVTSVFTWLTLVPPGHFNGYLDGWPFVFFFVYHYFLFFNVSVRKRLYGDYYARPHDPKWDVNLPMRSRFLFGAGVMVGHWLAAFEGPELHRIPGGWNNVGIWALIFTTLLMQYNATLYLAKYSENVVVPASVVQFGPYRWVRHPIYSSTMLLFVTYFLALRAPMSLLFIVAVCLFYYKQKAEMEEALMVETFGQSYTEYAAKVKYKFIPFIY